MLVSRSAEWARSLPAGQRACLQTLDRWERLEMDDLSRSTATGIALSLARTQNAPLSAADIQDLERAGEMRRLDAGTLLQAAGITVTHAHIVAQGRVRLALRSSTGGRQTIGLVGPGGVVADIPVLTQQRMPFDAVADVDSMVLTIEGGQLLSLLTGSPSLSLYWATLMAQRVEEAQRRTVTLLTKDLASQIATILLDHGSRREGTWIVPLSHQTIADLLGARRQSISRILGQMRRDGLVRSRYGSVEVTDLPGVVDLAGDPAGVGEMRDSA